jgi:hypothetical protein
VSAVEPVAGAGSEPWAVVEPAPALLPWGDSTEGPLGPVAGATVGDDAEADVAAGAGALLAGDVADADGVA